MNSLERIKIWQIAGAIANHATGIVRSARDDDVRVEKLVDKIYELAREALEIVYGDDAETVVEQCNRIIATRGDDNDSNEA
jgi:hypothetical protein